MRVMLIGVQPSELSYPFHDLRVLAKEVPSGVILHVFLEREFRARKQTNRNAWLSDSSETPGDRPAELGRHQLVANLCGSGCDKIQTVVTHRWCSSPAYSRSAPHLARISCNAPGESVGLRRSRVGEDTQADIPQISEVKLRFFHSRRNTIGRSSSLIVLIGLYRTWRWYGHTRWMHVVRNARVCSSRRRLPRCRRVGWRIDGPRASRRRQCRSLSLPRSSRGRRRPESRRMKLHPSRRSTVELSSRRRTTPTKTSAASSATARKTSRLDPDPVPLVSRSPSRRIGRR